MPSVKWCVNIDANLYERFMMEIGKRFGARRGVIQLAREEAIKDWIKKNTITESRSPICLP